MKPIWFSLFDFYTVAERCGGAVWEEGERWQKRQHALPPAVVVGPARPGLAA